MNINTKPTPAELKKFRESIRFTQAEFASFACVNTRNYQNWESKEFIPKSRWVSIFTAVAFVLDDAEKIETARNYFKRLCKYQGGI